MIKAYAVFVKGSRHEHAELVFAETNRKAKALAWKKPHGEFDYYDFLELRVQREKDADHLAKGKDEAFVCRDNAMFREAGWRGEDLDECACCGLTDFSGGDNQQWAVCRECDRCGECGHDEGCQVGGSDGPN